MEPDTRAHILVVDDERGPRESLRMILEPNHRVTPCASGARALEILRAGGVDLVTLDLNMPGIGGEELMRTIHSEFPAVEVIVITGCGSLASATAGIRYGICDYLQKPFDVLQVAAAVSRALARQRARSGLAEFISQLGAMVDLDREARRILDDVQRSPRLQSRLRDLFESRDPADSGAFAHPELDQTIEFLEVLAETIEGKDRFMRGHARRVAFYACHLAERLELSGEQREQLRIAAFLHDIGKVGVPTELLLRPAALTPSERRTVERHVEVGVRLIEPLDIPTPIAAAIHHHHEWWDGTGYPDGIAGEEIPLLARIISLADAFDAMSCDRPFRRAMDRRKAVAEIRRYSSVQFDPNLAKQFLVVLESGACDVDLELIADVVADARQAPDSTATH